jgi:hypothetical protein
MTKFEMEREDSPKTEAEQRIYDLLSTNGFKEIEFSNVFESSERYLRIGYWDRLPGDYIAMVGEDVIEECMDYDEDCGYLFCYTMKESVK